MEVNEEFSDYQSCKDDETTLNPRPVFFKSFGQVFQDIGSFNLFHLKFIIVYQIASLLFCGNYVFMSYATYEPEIKCVTADNNIIEMNHSNSNVFCAVYETGECVELHWKAPFKTIIEEWELICNLDYVPQMINSIQTSG